MGNSPSAGQSGGALPPAAARPQQQYAAGGAAAGFAGPHPYAAGPYGPPTGGMYPPGPGGYPPPYPGAYGGPRPMFMTPEVMQAMLLSGASPHVFLQQGGFAMPPQPVAPPRVEHATTVRNDVNLKKGSLKFLRDRRCPERLYLEFSFDAGQPCAITVYYAHRSDEGVPPGTSLVQRLVPYRAPHCGRRTLFRKGLGQTYSQALLEGGCEWLDLRAFNEEELTNAPGTGDGAPQSSAVALGGSAAAASPAGVPAERYAALPPNLFPVVITIETVPEGDPAHAAACAAGPTGTSVPVAGPAAAAAAPGSATSRVGLQVTYASVLHRPAEEERDHSPAPPAGDGSAPASPISASHAWIVKPLRQRIQIAGTVYELREIYGIEGSSTAPGGGGSASSASGGSGAVPGGPAGGAAAAAEDVLASGSECVVCLTDKRDTTVLPCRHMCLCYECAQQLRYSTNKCPICRAPVTSLLQIKIGGSAPSSDAGGARAS